MGVVHKAADAIDYPNVAAVHETDKAKTHVYIGVVYIEGPTMSEKFEVRPLKRGEAPDIGIQVAERPMFAPRSVLL